MMMCRNDGSLNTERERMDKTRLLLVDDDESFREVLRFHLAEAGYEVDTAADGEEGLAVFQQKLHPVVLTDLKMPKKTGLELMEEVHRRSPQTAVVVITAFGDIETAVDAMKAGAFDFLPKPVSRDHCKLIVKKAVEHVFLKARLSDLESRIDPHGEKILYSSAAMEEVMRFIEKAAKSDTTILLLGESGTGKEIVAKRIHATSDRSSGPFIPVNCAAIPKDLLESELFGHVKGAFTGATRDRKGKFQLADGGTILLDEIAELPQELQPRLLRVLQERVIDVIGGEKQVPVDIRVIAATNRDIKESVESGAFREDLYFRLNVVPIEIPPLRDRREDILLLAKHFLESHGKGRVFKLTEELQRLLETHTWPGNVRELENVIQRMIMLADGEKLECSLLPPALQQVEAEIDGEDESIRFSIPPEGISLEKLERRIIVEALKKNGGNQAKTARFLQIPRHVLLYRLEKYKITV